MSAEAELAIIVVSYGSAAHLPELVRSVDAAADGLSWQLTVVDNWPGGEDLAAVVGLDERVSIVRPGENLGYSGGLNLGVTRAGSARTIVFLNPDLVLRPSSLRRLVTHLEAGSAAAVPLLVDQRGRPQLSIRREPSLLAAWGDAVFGDTWPGRPPYLSETVRDPDRYARAHPVDWATGAALAVRSEVVRCVGAWDEDRFFLYSEETDFARRIREQGGQIAFVPDAVMVHHEGGSGTSPQLDALLEVNKLRYYRKWHPAPASAVFGVLLLGRNLIRPHRAGSRAAVRALLSARARARLPGGPR